MKAKKSSAGRYSTGRFRNTSGRRDRKQKRQKVTFGKLLRTSWKYQGKIFFAESTLHGVRYIAETDRPLIERLIWFACVLAGAISTIVIIVSLWEKFQTNPTITGLDTDFHNWDIPFPAVTLCPSEPWHEERLNEYVQKMTTEHQLNETVNDTEYSAEFDAILKGQDLSSVVYGLMQTCDEFFAECTFKTEAYNCCSTNGFYPIFTENGFCFTFNSIHYALRAADGKLFPKLDENNLMFIKETDPKWSLEFLVTTEKNISIFVHKGNELPGINLKAQYVWDFKLSTMSFSMRETYTTDDATQLSIRQRHCIFDHEVALTIDEDYTYAACAHQCRMNNARRHCSCIPHFYELFDGYSHCNASQLKCIAERKENIVQIESCGCELGCSNTVYEVDKLSEDGSEKSPAGEEGEGGDGEMPGLSLLDDTEENSTTSVPPDETEEEARSEALPDTGTDKEIKKFALSFTSWPMIKYKREVLFGWVDLLVSFGGIAGLFLGFSLLSGVEIIYYFTIRACCMIYKQRDELEKMATATKKREVHDLDLSLVPYFIREPMLGQGEDMLRRRMKENANFKVQPLHPLKPIIVKPVNPTNKIMPPFGYDYYN